MDYELIKPDQDDAYDPAPFLSYARLRSDAKAERDPDIGDIVHFWDDRAARCRAALVFDLREVSFDEPCTADLAVFEADGQRQTLDVPHVEQRCHHTWHWPCGGR